MKKIIKSDYFIYTILTIVLLLFTTYALTRPAFISAFNFTETGPIGDTIGGLTSPVINILGAILIYISFKEQVKANKSLQNDIINQTQDRNFQIALDLFKEFKNEYKSLSYNGHFGQSALNIFANELAEITNIEELHDYRTKPIFFNWQYLMCEYDLLMEHILYSNLKKNERSKIIIVIHNYYVLQLEYAIDIIKEKFEQFETEKSTLEIISKFKKRHLKYSQFVDKRKIDFPDVHNS